MGEVVASIRDHRGCPPTIEGWVRSCGGADTIAVAARFSMSTEDARKELRKLERSGVLRSRRDKSTGGYRWGGVVLMWEAT